MLSVDQINALGESARKITEPVTDFLVEDIARRVSEAGQFTSTASYQIWLSQQQGVSQKELKKKLQKLLDKSADEVEQLLTQSAEVGYNFDISRFPTAEAIPFAENTSLQQIVAAAIKVAGEEIKNLSRTTGFVCPDGKARILTEAYQNACDFAVKKVVLGGQDYIGAIREATRGLAEKGILQIDYKSGRHRSVEAAVRSSVMGGVGKIAEEVNNQNFDLLNCDGYEISAHMASAPDHMPFQGRQYTKAEFDKLQKNLVRPIGAIGLGCGHWHFPIIMGVNAPQYTEEELEQMRRDNETGVTVDGRHYTTYEATQRQRQLERAIRNQKRKILIDKTVDDPDKLQTDQIRLVRLRDEYARFSKEAGLPTQHARAEAAGFTWQDGKAAEKATKNAGIQKETLANRSSSAIMKVESGGRRNETPLTEAQIQECLTYAEHLGMDRERIRYGEHYNTSYGSTFDMLYIGTDAYPSQNGKTANQKLSYKCALAHEIIGHRQAFVKGTSLSSVDKVLDEVQASIRAARFADGLSQSERTMLLRDAIERLKNSGRKIREVKHLLDIESR